MQCIMVEPSPLKMECVHDSYGDFFDHEPSKAERLEMRRASKTPSEWLQLLCSDWAAENAALVANTDARFIEYKSYLRGQLTSQLLCRLSIHGTENKEHGLETTDTTSYIDFWKILGIEDEFDKSYIVAQVERFCVLYGIRAPMETSHLEDDLFDHVPVDAASAAAAAAAGISVPPNIVPVPAFHMDPNSAHAAHAAAAAAAAAADLGSGKLTRKQVAEVNKAHRMAKDAEKALEIERRQSMKREQRRISQERKDIRNKEREAINLRKAAEKAAREATREERRRKKLEIRKQREEFARQQKDAALKRAAELVQSNRVPIEITRGAAAAQAAANAAVAAACAAPPPMPSNKKQRSCIVVSTASDLDQIVTHSKNLWSKYNAIAKEHNQKVNWIVVAKELGIHVKVREKYARMHARAEQRGFDFKNCGHFKIKDYPHIFLEPTQAEQKAKIPPPPPDASTTVLINGTKEAPEALAIAAQAAVAQAQQAQAAQAHAVAAQAVAAQVAANQTLPVATVDPTAQVAAMQTPHIPPPQAVAPMTEAMPMAPSPLAPVMVAAPAPAPIADPVALQGGAPLPLLDPTPVSVPVHVHTPIPTPVPAAMAPVPHHHLTASPTSPLDASHLGAPSPLDQIDAAAAAEAAAAEAAATAKTAAEAAEVAAAAEAAAEAAAAAVAAASSVVNDPMAVKNDHVSVAVDPALATADAVAAALGGPPPGETGIPIDRHKITEI
mmetsp:Transcript_10983/g.16397  ORF Transcript_10983/g.16397 Transcript_10983/m.16397 type:complete len:726 (+) Transcript_10983:101-2278(+)